MRLVYRYVLATLVCSFGLPVWMGLFIVKVGWFIRMLFLRLLIVLFFVVFLLKCFGCCLAVTMLVAWLQ